MYQLILWFNMISFTLMVASAGLAYVVYSRNGAIWLRDYLAYAFSFAFWLLFATWVFFQQVYLEEPAPQLTLVFGWVRSAVSLAVAYWGPLFFLQAAGYERTGRLRALVAGADALLALVILAFLLFNLTLLGRATTLVFNAAFAVLGTLAFVRLRARRASPMRSLLPVAAYAMVAHIVLTVLSVAITFIVRGQTAIHTNALATGAFVFLWALLAIVVLFRWIGGREQAENPVPPAFLSDYSITAREAEILRILVTGKTSAEIGEELFISQRTVEAHLYSVYRKCGVSKRVELLNRIASYRG